MDQKQSIDNSWLFNTAPHTGPFLQRPLCFWALLRHAWLYFLRWHRWHIPASTWATSKWHKIETLLAEGPGSIGNMDHPSLQLRWYCCELLSHCLWNGSANHDLTRKTRKWQKTRGKGQKENAMCKISEISQEEESQGGCGWGEHRRKAAKQWEEVNFSRAEL